MNKELVGYVSKAVSLGYTPEQIRENLATNGWDKTDVERAIFTVTSRSAPDALRHSHGRKYLIVFYVLLLVVAVATTGFFAYSFFLQLIPPSDGAVFLPTPQDGIVEQPTTITPSAPSQELMDCGTDFDCFRNASTSCRPAKVLYSTTIELAGVTQAISSNLEIRGNLDSTCLFYIQNNNIEIVFPPEVTTDDAELQRQMLKQFEGRDGTCQFLADSLSIMLARWDNGEFSTEDWATAECSGRYFDWEI